MPVDKRCDEQRVDIARPVELLDPDVGLGVSGYTKNLSPSGMRARLDVAPTPGNNLQLAINLADGTSPLETRGEVIWCIPDRGGEGAEIGLKFLSEVDKVPFALNERATWPLAGEIQTLRLGQRLMLDTVDQLIEVCVEEIIQNDSHPEGSIQLNLSVQNRLENIAKNHELESEEDLLSSAEMWKPHPLRDLIKGLKKYLGPVLAIATAICLPCVRVLGIGLEKLFRALPPKMQESIQVFGTRLNLKGKAVLAVQVWTRVRCWIGSTGILNTGKQPPFVAPDDKRPQ